MRILVDLQSAQSGSRHGGIGRYSMDLLRSMLENHKQHDFHILLNSLMPDGISDIYAALYGLIPRGNFHIFTVPGPVCRAEKDNESRSIVSKLIRDAFVAKINPDVVHITSLIEGYMDEVVVSTAHQYYKGPVFVTLYDLIPLVEKDRYLADPHVRRYYFDMMDELKNSTHLLAISEYSKQEAMQELGFPDKRITNISSALSPFFKSNEKVADVGLVKRKYGITSRYFLYTASFDQRKNQAGLIEAFSMLPPQDRDGLQLVIVGNGWEAIYQELKCKARSFGLKADDVVFTGKVSDDDLHSLYSGCFAFVFPSFREGFGLPILEAMSCGAPVIASNTTCIPEVVGWDEAMFDPSSPEDISKKMKQVLLDTGFRHDLVKNSRERLNMFSWDRSAAIAVGQFEISNFSKVEISDVSVSNVVEDIASLSVAGKLTESDILKIASSLYALESEEVIGGADFEVAEVALISTWNTKCGIADYSKALMSACDFNYAVLAPVVSDEHLVAEDESFVVRCWELGSRDLSDLAYYIAKVKAKVVVLQFNYGLFDFAALDELLRFLLKRKLVVYAVMHSTSDPEELRGCRELKMLAGVLSELGGILVHSHADIRRLANLGVHNSEILTHGLPKVVCDKGEAIGALSSRKKEGYLIATFGYILPGKGLREAVRVAALLRAQGVQVKLLMLNAEYDSPISKAEIEAVQKEILCLGVQDVVELRTDFLPLDECHKMLAEADVIFFPYQKTGESSSAAVRNALATLRPVMVTPLEIFDDVSEAVVKFSSNDPGDMANELEQFLASIRMSDPALLSVLERGREWVRANTADLVSARFCEKLSEHF